MISMITAELKYRITFLHEMQREPFLEMAPEMAKMTPNDLLALETKPPRSTEKTIFYFP